MVLGSELEAFMVRLARDIDVLWNGVEGRSGSIFRRFDKIAVGPDEERRRPSPPVTLNSDLVSDCLGI